ncbi:PulJ/GspJ family protein [Crateriforma conspicua]|uniref:PulJ/GspJ family protein n=1 Tax=Crateriforma conspicua TaxID=2527996 RepID=UPI0013FCFA2E|nr:prepilin-type N-terminal cleavage/methylation domain-containing protein [Crateriforma conspicua]
MNRKSIAVGFTLVEMMVAMAITLLLMAALASSFGKVGQQVRVSRAQVDLSSRVRDVTRRMRDELSRCTANPAATGSDKGEGYLVYFDGPISNITATLMGRAPAEDNEYTLQDSRFGDYDDYLAFTAKAPEGSPFTGKVPRFVLDAKTAEANGVAYNAANFPGGVAGALDPVVITSQYAEIIYYVSPQYQTSLDTANNGQSIHVYDTAAQPTIVDLDGNGIPDQMKLHRRVLLIRPDLNLNGVTTLGPALPQFTSGNYTYLQPDTWPSDASTGLPAIKTPGGNGLNQSQAALAWLIGMGPIHQQCDLSVGRRLMPNGAPSTSNAGNFVFANSLDDLQQPHNRFAHVRVPQTILGISPPNGTNGYTSMPLLALGGVAPILEAATINTPSVAPPYGGAPGFALRTRFVTPTFLNGFLRPEFILGQDLSHTDTFGDGWGIERVGEDVLLTNVLSFDVKAFDPGVQTYVSPGPDGQFGVAGVDDDQNGTVDDGLSINPALINEEVGFVGSDDHAVTPNDPSYYDVLWRYGQWSGSGTIAGNRQPPAPGVMGAFVDLGYAVQAGGAVRGNAGLLYDAFSGVARPVLNPALIPNTRFSAYNQNARYVPQYGDNLLASGRMITNGGRIVLYQPAFDTFTSEYESDGYLQWSRSDPNTGVHDGTLWWLNNNDGSPPSTLPGNAASVDPSTNGLDDVAASTGGNSFGSGSIGERETAPPFASGLPALNIEIRVENTQVREVEQSSVAKYFGD